MKTYLSWVLGNNPRISGCTFVGVAELKRLAKVLAMKMRYLIQNPDQERKSMRLITNLPIELQMMKPISLNEVIFGKPITDSDLLRVRACFLAENHGFIDEKERFESKS